MATDGNKKKKSATEAYLGEPPKYIKDWIRRRRTQGILTYVSCKGKADPYQSAQLTT